MSFENQAGMMDKVFDLRRTEGFLLMRPSAMYLNGCVVDYVETLEGRGLQVRTNPDREEHLRLRIVLQCLALFLPMRRNRKPLASARAFCLAGRLINRLKIKLRDLRNDPAFVAHL